MPPVSRSIFYGFGAWVGQTTGPTSCGWWAQDPNTLNPTFDSTKLIYSNLANNPQAHIVGGLPVDQIEVDNSPLNGGLTKIGATFPNGSMLDSCWMDKIVYDSLDPSVKPPRVPSDVECRDYELTTVYYWSGPLANRRFWGFYAEIDSENGQSALVSIWPAGKSLVRGQLAAGSWWLQLDNVAHPIESGFTFIGVGLHPKQGALFLDAPTVNGLGLSGPKLPPASGADVFPPIEAGSQP